MSLFTLFVVRRNNAVLEYYGYVLHQVRRVFYGAHYTELNRLLSVGVHPAVIARPFRISDAAEKLCLSTAVCLPLCMTVASIIAAFSGELGWPKYLAVTIALATLITTLMILYRDRRRSRSARSLS